ncbi:nicotinate (nicotinamide) nucleotide adenylyltransferase [uncultured Dysosmobacter sp.]|uniref:nicotinate (nicotinamide) nucleotide adenylyltransferase n=1 Tax=uncultured Dysosmobacter sp. TaxID=2591384 RepID=UPI00261AAE3D|nr:nicotinate (nicotinamide) nucleotide adenylyltransferase [uncultured Dysosmobacter sp.]
MNTIVFFGGAFDPIHTGHLQLCRAAYETVRPEQVILMPSMDSGHKHMRASAEDRLQMCRLAAEPYPWLNVSDLEIRRKLCYTADTLRILSEQYQVCDFWLLLGEDQICSLPYWSRWQEFAPMSNVLAVHRPGCLPAITQLAEQRLLEAGCRVFWLDCERMPVSSTGIRRMLRSVPASEVEELPPSVRAYIQRTQLYSGETC